MAEGRPVSEPALQRVLTVVAVGAYGFESLPLK